MLSYVIVCVIILFHNISYYITLCSIIIMYYNYVKYNNTILYFVLLYYIYYNHTCVK